MRVHRFPVVMVALVAIFKVLTPVTAVGIGPEQIARETLSIAPKMQMLVKTMPHAFQEMVQQLTLVVAQQNTMEIAAKLQLIHRVHKLVLEYFDVALPAND